MNWARPLKVKKKKNTGVLGKLDWKALGDNKCPKCFHDMTDNEAKSLFICGRDKCDFAITKAKFEEITSRNAGSSGILKGRRRDLSEEEQNLSELNNL